jgi:peptide/nickel transport system permease protein
VRSGDIVRAQFAKHRTAVWALRALIALAVVTTYAPVFVLDVPLWTNLPGTPASPWLRSLFDPTVFEDGVDVFFNLLMGTLPIIALGWWLLRGRSRIAVVSSVVGVHLVTFLVLIYARDGLRQPPSDYPKLVHAADADAIWPLVRHHPKGRSSEYSLTPPLSRGRLMRGAEEPPEALWPYFVLGSDNLGNDALARLIYGGRISLTIGVLAVAVYVTIGVAFGALAGYFGKWVDDLLMYVAQVVMVIPFLFLCLFILSVVETQSVFHIVVVIALVFWPTPMRLVRAEFLRQREIDYVTAARALGVTDGRVIFRHILPNVLGPVFVTATFGVASTVLLESTLAFLGFSEPGVPSWGQILRIGYENMDAGSHLIWIGGLAIFFLVLLVNIVGEALRDALDPKLRK